MQRIFNLGCKLNQYEGFCLLKKFADSGDVVIVNTCCVTKQAEHKSIKKFRYALRKYPEARIIATGCACRLSPEKFTAADQIIDNIERLDVIKGVMPQSVRIRYFLKIQDGCDQLCSFCIVPRLRNRLWSKSLSAIKREIKWAVAHGYKEVVLVGANIGLYGKECSSSLIELLKSLSRSKNLPRIRLSSLEPQFIDKQIISVLKDLPFCRHFHISIQSADDAVLLSMKRRYRVSELEKKIELVNNSFDAVAIGADVIVGFPNEEQLSFENTYHFIKKEPFSHLHIFPYSPRPGTEALKFGDPISRVEKKRRLWQLKGLIIKKNFHFRKQLSGQRFTIITEVKNKVISGLTDNYVRVIINEHYRSNMMLPVRITQVTEQQTFGEVEKNDGETLSD